MSLWYSGLRNSIAIGGNKLSYNLGLISLGCPKNLVDSEIMLGAFKEKGFVPVEDLSQADAIIINTCAFVGDAKEEAIVSILEASRQKEEGQLKALVVTGCLAQRYREEIISEIPEVDLVFGTGSITRVAEQTKAFLDGESLENHIWCDIPNTVDYLDNTRVLSDNKPYAYLKIAEGCSNNCTYCIIPKLRGPYRSRPVENILKEAEFLAAQGKKEIVLIAQDVTFYGTDLYGEKRLVELIRALSCIEKIRWIRLLYCYPELIDDALIQEMKSNSKLACYMDIPVQHISESILKAMGRRGSGQYIESLLKHMKKEIPHIALRTSLISGFPGETEDDHQKLKGFVEKGYFQHLGVFAYSREEGTPAYRMKDQVPSRIKEARRKALMEAQQKNVGRFNSSRIGKTYDTIIDGVAEDGIFYLGRTYMEAPEIDPVIYVASSHPLDIGDVVKVKMLCCDEYDLIGEVTGDESSK
jgi:ribosomal protein S12 methylthiotransferase